MAAEVRQSHGVDVELVEGGGGVFRVLDGDRLIYDKAKTGCFPQVGEVSDLLSQS